MGRAPLVLEAAPYSGADRRGATKKSTHRLWGPYLLREVACLALHRVEFAGEQAEEEGCAPKLTVVVGELLALGPAEVFLVLGADGWV